MSLDGLPKAEDMKIGFKPPKKNWMDTKADFRPGTYSYPTAAKNLKILDMPNAWEWSPTDEDWKLPDNWQQIILDGFKERLEKYRSFRIFMEVCVRCGACADKCHFFLGGGDPKNMPVLRAELIRSVYRNDFTTLGKMLGKFGGGPSGLRFLASSKRLRILFPRTAGVLPFRLRRQAESATGNA